MVARKKYLWQHKDGRWYVRIKGRYSRIDAAEGSPDFDRQYWEILSGKRAQTKTSWRSLIEDYRTSDRWTDLKPRTRSDYERPMAYIIEKIGTKDVQALTRSDVIAAQKANAHRTRFANYIPQMFVILCEHAIDLGWIDRNPAKGVRALKTPDERKQTHVPWPDWAVNKMRADALPLPRLIFEIGIGTAQRPGDWTGFTWGDYDPSGDGTLRLRQSKTDKPLILPCTVMLKSTLENNKAALGYVPLASKPILCGPTGGRMGYRTMAAIMLRERRRLELAAFDLHALRYRGIKELAWAGCSDDEIASYSGHATKAMIAKYAGEARQEMNARSARIKRQ